MNLDDPTKQAADALARANHEYRGMTDVAVYRLLADAVLAAVTPTIRAAVASEISDAILAARADDLGDGYTAGARTRESDAAIARQIGGVSGLDEFRPRGDA